MELLLGTQNTGKILEMRDALEDLPIVILTPDALGIREIPHEEGDSFEANALLKAQFYFSRTGIPTLTDDSGILVDAMQGEMGIHTRRWGPGTAASDEEWIAAFLERMHGEENRHATFTCTLCFINAAREEHLFTGQCTGLITDTLESTYLPGLPISACFKPLGSSTVYAAMDTEQKNYTSHRGKALLELRSFLERSMTRD
jgi:XTP/dITP diphosphohydrolase